MEKFEKGTSHGLNIFIKIKPQLSWQNTRQKLAHMTLSVHLHRHDMLHGPLTVLLHCPITSMTRTVSYSCSNQACDSQSRSRILL